MKVDIMLDINKSTD